MLLNGITAFALQTITQATICQVLQVIIADFVRLD